MILESQKIEFAELMESVMAVYGKDVNKFILKTWFACLQKYDMPSVTRAFEIHVRKCKFAPKPSEIIEIIEGSGSDKAGTAWVKVHKAIRCIGKYESIVFDDALIHAVISDMGGWSYLCEGQEKDLVFRQKEFETKYRAFCDREILPEYPQKLIGRYEKDNLANGQKVSPPMMIGEPKACGKVFIGGAKNRPIKISHMQDKAKSVAAALIDNKAGEENEK